MRSWIKTFYCFRSAHVSKSVQFCISNLEMRGPRRILWMFLKPWFCILGLTLKSAYTIIWHPRVPLRECTCYVSDCRAQCFICLKIIAGHILFSHSQHPWYPRFLNGVDPQFRMCMQGWTMYRHEHSALLHLCQYVFSHVKPPWQPPNHFHLLLRVSGMHCRIICRPSQLFLFLEELSNIIYSCLLTLTVVQNLVWSNQLNVSHFVDTVSTIAIAQPVNTMPPI